VSTTTKLRGKVFRADEVLAVLRGDKTQFRDVVKPQPPSWLAAQIRSGFRTIREVEPGVFGAGTGSGGAWVCRSENMVRARFSVGDRLFVKETYWLINHGNTFRGTGITYLADDYHECISRRPRGRGKLCCWRPASQMPEWASRLTLEITDVRCERLQAISKDDARAEGVRTEPYKGTVNGEPATIYPIDPAYQFVLEWNARNSKHPWASDPFVFAYTFKVSK
jgi:hypothetical protein